MITKKKKKKNPFSKLVFISPLEETEFSGVLLMMRNLVTNPPKMFIDVGLILLAVIEKTKNKQTKTTTFLFPFIWFSSS